MQKSQHSNKVRNKANLGKWARSSQDDIGMLLRKHTTPQAIHLN